MEHRKFLKTRNGWMEPGEFVPDAEIGSEKWRVSEYIADYLILVTMSTSCEPCMNALEALHDCLQIEKPINLLMIVDCEAQDVPLFQKEFEGLAAVRHCAKDDMRNALNTTVYPWAYGINSVGQIVTSSVCGSERELAEVLRPFYRYTGTGR